MKEFFELEMLDGMVLREYRKLRPEVESLPWGTLKMSSYSPEAIEAARLAWTGAAYQEFRTGAACAATVQALYEARAPLDLIALATRFPLDEIVHVELCSRLVGEMGGAVPWSYDAEHLVDDIGQGITDPILRAAHKIVAYFCVGESISIPLLKATARSASQSLIKKILQKIVADEVYHGLFGWMYLDWAVHHLSQSQLVELGVTADTAISAVVDNWESIADRSIGTREEAHGLGWMETDRYLRLARLALKKQVIVPLVRRGIPISLHSPTHRGNDSLIFLQ